MAARQGIKPKKSLQKWLLKHGLFYRIYWGIVILISIWGFLTISMLTFRQFYADSISIGVETTYLDWNNTFPAVSLCLIRSRSFTEVEKYIKSLNLPEAMLTKKFVRNLHEYIFTNPTNMFFKPNYCDGLNSTCGVNILQFIRDLLPTSCETFMMNVSYLGIDYANCSDIFKFHKLEMGYCFLANNLLDSETINRLPLRYTISNTDLSLKFALKNGFIWRYELYVHSPEDFPSFSDNALDTFSDAYVYLFNVNEYKNDVEVRNEPVAQRSCKFPDEMDKGSPWHYSKASCMSYLRIQNELAACNCTHFTSPEKYEAQYCDIYGLQCLMHEQTAETTRHQVLQDNLCYPSCTEQEINLVGYYQLDNVDVDNSIYIDIQVANMPTIRYNRVVSRTNLDLIVSVGGIIGLFAGASVLNIVELIYLCLRRS